MKTYTIIFLCCLLPLHLWAQSTQTVRGRVIDQQTQRPIAQATVRVAQTALGALTDSTGAFEIRQVPVGWIALLCQYPGYAAYQSEDYYLNSAKAWTTQLELAPMAYEVSEVEIVADPYKPQSPFPAVSGMNFSMEQTQIWAGTVNDPSRMAMGFPGVQASQDDNSDIIIRGNAPSGLLWRLEGIDIPNPNHFARKGNTGGGITIFSAQLLGKSDFYTGAFSADYGNALAGVFDIRFRPGNPEARESRFKLGLLGIDLATEGPLNKNGASYLVNYRYSTLGILNAMGYRLAAPRKNNTFQDLSFNLYFPSKDQMSRTTIFGMGGLSAETEDPVSDSLRASRFYRTVRDYGTRMGAVGVTHQRFIGDHGYIKAVVALMGDRVNDNDDTLDIRNVLTYPNDPALAEGLDSARIETEEYNNWRLSTHVYYNQEATDRFLFRVGVIASHINFSFEHQRRAYDENNRGLDSFVPVVGGAGSSQLLQAYVQTRTTLTDRLVLNAGLHSMFLTLNNNYTLEPRASLRYELSPRQSLSLAYGLHGQILPLGHYYTTDEAGNMPNKDLEMMKSHHFIASYQVRFPNRLRLMVEGYYQALYDIPVAADTSTFSILNVRHGYAEEALVSQGTGQNVGVDVTVQKSIGKGTFFLLTGSLYNSTYTTLIPDEVFDTKYNGRFGLSAMGGKEWPIGENSSLMTSARIVLNGGLRYQAIDTELSYGDLVVYDEDQAWTQTRGNYFRTDLRIAYRWNRKLAYLFSLDLQNATNHQNVLEDSWNAWMNNGAGGIYTRYQAGLIPVFSFQVDF